MKLPLAGLLEGLAAPLARRVLAGIGMGMISFAVISTGLNMAIAFARGHFNGMPAYAFAFVGVSGLGTGLGMIAGALVFRATLASMPQLGAMKK